LSEKSGSAPRVFGHGFTLDEVSLSEITDNRKGDGLGD